MNPEELKYLRALQPGIVKAMGEWRDVPGYEGRYAAHPAGYIWSYWKRKIIVPSINCKGYRCVGLTKNRKTFFTKVSRVIGQTFIPNPLGLPHINHKDGNKANNSVANLEWCDPTYNMRHAAIMGLCGIGERNHNAKLSNAQVREIRELVAMGHKYRELSNRYGVAFETISAIARRTQRRYD